MKMAFYLMKKSKIKPNIHISYINVNMYQHLTKIRKPSLFIVMMNFFCLFEKK